MVQDIVVGLIVFLISKFIDKFQRIYILSKSNKPNYYKFINRWLYYLLVFVLVVILIFSILI